MSLRESHQAFEVAAAKTSGLVNRSCPLSSNYFFQCEYLFTYQPMVIIEPAVLIAGLLDLGSKLNPSNINFLFRAGSTKILLDSCRVFLEYVKIEQVKERLLL